MFTRDGSGIRVDFRELVRSPGPPLKQGRVGEHASTNRLGRVPEGTKVPFRFPWKDKNGSKCCFP